VSIVPEDGAQKCSVPGEAGVRNPHPSPRMLLLTSFAPCQAAVSAIQRSKTTQTTGAPQGGKPTQTSGTINQGADGSTRKVRPGGNPGAKR